MTIPLGLGDITIITISSKSSHYPLVTQLLYVINAPITVIYMPHLPQYGEGGDLNTCEIKFPTMGLYFAIKSRHVPHILRWGNEGI